MNNDNNTISIHDMPKLTWACRRGMLELDVLLGNFLKEAYLQLSDDKKEQFVALLSCSDPEILAWIMGHERPQDANMANIAELIRQHARSRI